MTRRIRFAYTVIACFAACQNDGAPSAGGTEPAAMMDPKQSAAGAPAAAANGVSSTLPDTAATPAASGAMASAGSAGSSSDSKPAEQPAKNPPAAASCELPNTYTRATRATVEVSWPETLALTAGTGKLVTWGKVTYTKRSDGAIEMESRPCGSLQPVMITSELVGGLKSATQIPFKAFDSPNMPALRTVIMQRPDRSFTFRFGIPLGTMLSDPDDKWPSPTMLEPFDHDGDGSPGVTTLPLDGPEYTVPPTSISLQGSIDRLYLASRMRIQVSVTPACSGTAVGPIEPLGFDSTIVGCHVKNGDDCNEAELDFIRAGRFNYTLGKSGGWAEVEVPKDASCADVRAALPAP